MPSKTKPVVIVEELVAPIESVAETQEKTSDTIDKDACWNCQTPLVDNKCSKCGFDLSLLYNLDLEAQAAIKKQKAQQAQLALVK